MRGYQRGHLHAAGGQRPSWQAGPAVGKTRSDQHREKGIVKREEVKNGRHRKVPADFWWTIRDLNPGPTGYEPAALTNCANGPQIEKGRR